MFKAQEHLPYTKLSWVKREYFLNPELNKKCSTIKACYIPIKHESLQVKMSLEIKTYRPEKLLNSTYL